MAKKASIIPAHLQGNIHYNAAEEYANNTIGMRITEARKANGLSLVNMASLLTRCGIELGPTALNKWERGISVPNSYQLVAICKILGIDNPDYFTENGIVSDLNDVGTRKLAEYKADLLATGLYTPEHRKTAGKVIYIDMPVSYLAASAGTGAFLDEGNFETISFPIEMVPTGAEFGIRVAGDSMTPVYQDGQIVWVKQCNTLEPGQVGIFVCDGEGFIKKYDEQDPEDVEAFTDSNGVCHRQPVLISYNPAYAPRVISPDSHFEIVGRVLK